MKDGRFHLKYKAENAVDGDTEIIVAVEIYHGNVGDTSTVEDTVNTARTHLRHDGTEFEIKEVGADRGYHSEAALDCLQNESHVRTYIPEANRKTNRNWKNESALRESPYRRNRRSRRNTRGVRGRRLQRWRSERVERSFAQLCDTVVGRRTWLRGLGKVHKRYMTTAMAHNLGCIMRLLIDAGKPRYAAVLAERLCFLHFAIEAISDWLTGLRRLTDLHHLSGNWTTSHAPRVERDQANAPVLYKIRIGLHASCAVIYQINDRKAVRNSIALDIFLFFCRKRVDACQIESIQGKPVGINSWQIDLHLFSPIPAAGKSHQWQRGQKKAELCSDLAVNGILHDRTTHRMKRRPAFLGIESCKWLI